MSPGRGAGWRRPRPERSGDPPQPLELQLARQPRPRSVVGHRGEDRPAGLAVALDLGAEGGAQVVVAVLAEPAELDDLEHAAPPAAQAGRDDAPLEPPRERAPALPRPG